MLMNVPYFQNYAHKYPIILELFSLKLLPIILKIMPALGTRRFRQQNYWNNRNTKATSKMLA